MKSQKVYAHEVRDEKGRRRFHGAFTGGFSAGYFNTVSTEAGWAPSQFVSSRSSRADIRQQKPEDYMDDHDGILGMKLSVSDQFDSTSKRMLSDESFKEAGSSMSIEAFSWDPASTSAGRRLLMRLSARSMASVASMDRPKIGQHHSSFAGLGSSSSSSSNVDVIGSSSRYYVTDLMNSKSSSSSSVGHKSSDRSFGFHKRSDNDDDDDDHAYESGMRDFQDMAYDANDDDEVESDLPSLISGFVICSRLSSSLPPMPDIKSSSSSNIHHVFPTSSSSHHHHQHVLEVPSLSSRFTNKSSSSKPAAVNLPIVVRSVKSWNPVALLSKRCNVPPISSSLSSSVMMIAAAAGGEERLAEEWMMETYNQVFSTESTDINQLKQVFNCIIPIDNLPINATTVVSNIEAVVMPKRQSRFDEEPDRSSSSRRSHSHRRRRRSHDGRKRRHSKQR